MKRQIEWRIGKDKSDGARNGGEKYVQREGRGKERGERRCNG